MAERATHCPHCGVSLQGEPIPQEYIDRELYGPGVTHYSRTLGYEIQGVYDGVLYWVCPDCNKAWARFTDDDRLSRASAEYVERHNKDLP